MRQGLSRLVGPPLIVQLIGLLIGALVAAQLVTLLLTLVLPPAPPRAYRLNDIAATLSTGRDGDDRFDRIVQSGPPDFSARGWFVSADARTSLAGMLNRSPGDVALGFYTQLPVGGMVEPVAPPRRLPPDAERVPAARIGLFEPKEEPPAQVIGGNIEIAFSGAPTVRPIRAALLQQMPGAPPGGGFPGGGPPGGGFPGRGVPGGGFPQSLPQPSARAPAPAPAPLAPQPQPQQPVRSIAPPAAATIPPSPERALPPSPASVPPLGQAPPGGGSMPMGVLVPPPSLARLPALQPPPQQPSSPAGRSQPPPNAAMTAPALPATDRSTPRVVIGQPDAATTPVGAAAPPTGGEVRPRVRSPAPIAVDPSPVPILRPASGLFGLAPAPFVEGDFAAGIRRADGRWAIVTPKAEGFPSAWQRRVGLWFLLSLLAVAPIAWLFARRIVGPLDDFARAAEMLGRDPGVAVMPLDGPAEIGRAAHAFNQMQSRLRGFVDDRTAMIGAISHDLRTPLTRLRFRIEEVPDGQQDGLRGEVDEMEAMIASVIAFMRDASIPHARERRDLAEIVDDVVEGATLLGDVRAERMDSAIVDVDPLGIRRVLDNLLTNAMKYGGGQARVALRVEADRAVADIVDSGPGVPEGELERIFEPFYRSEAVRRSRREGSGLGLAVCRSIARAHGGDVALFRSPAGFTARVTLPLAFPDERRAA